jgi:hypothetical protein
VPEILAQVVIELLGGLAVLYDFPLQPLDVCQELSDIRLYRTNRIRRDPHRFNKTGILANALGDHVERQTLPGIGCPRLEGSACLVVPLNDLFNRRAVSASMSDSTRL